MYIFPVNAKGYGEDAALGQTHLELLNLPTKTGTFWQKGPVWSALVGGGGLYAFMLIMLGKKIALNI